MSDPAYKYFDEADNFLANFMEFFPSLYGEVVTLDQFQNAVNNLILPTITNSVQFCESVQSGIITNTILGAGGFGAVGDFLMTEDQDAQPVYAIIVSINPNGGMEPFYVPVIIKTGLQHSRINIDAGTVVLLPASSGADDAHRYIKIININDPVTEIVFGSMLGHLYDLGLCPFYSKYFSSYICNTTPDPDLYSISFVLEKASITMHDFMYYEPYMGAIRANTEILMNIIFQYIYAVYIGKMYLGFTHFDAHLANVMITHTSNNTIPGPQNISYIYQGKNLETKQYILINLGITYKGQNAWLAMKYNGLMVKIIDYGSCAAYLYAAQYPNYKRNFLIKTETIYPGFVTDNDYQTCQNSSQRRNTWEIQFFLTCLHQSMYNGNAVGATPDLARRALYQNNINVLNDFTRHFYGDAQYNIGTYLDTNPLMKNIDPLTNTIRGFPERTIDIDIPAFSDPRELLKGLARYCLDLDHITENRPIIGTHNGALFFLETDLVGTVFDLENSLVFENGLNQHIKAFNNMDKFMKNAKKVETGCDGRTFSNDIFTENGTVYAPTDVNRQALCRHAKQEMQKWHPANTMRSNLISPLSSNTSYNQITGTFNSNIRLTEANFPRQLQASDLGENLSIFKMQINPRALRMRLDQLGALVYSNYQNWIDFNPLRADLNDQPIEIVRLNIIVVDPKDTYNVKLNNLANLWDTTKLSTSTCFSINGGYFACQPNLDELTRNIITQDDVNQQRPIGFCFNEDVNDGTNGTYLPVPKPYRPHFGVIWCSYDNVLHIDTHEEFMSWHETIDQPIGYLLDNGTIYTTVQSVIRMDGHRNATITDGRRGHIPVMNTRYLEKNGIRLYKWAFCSGVLLVDNNQVVFDLNMMLDTRFLIVDTDIQAVGSTITKPLDLTEYKVLQASRNNYKFKSADHNDTADVYGVKVSNRYSIHNVMGITNTGKIMFFLVEGRGFNAVGLDRVQVAYLVNKFGIYKAISLDGGFSANAVYKMDDDDTPKYVQNDPQKRRLSTSMTFTFNNPEDSNHPEEIGYTGETPI